MWTNQWPFINIKLWYVMLTVDINEILKCFNAPAVSVGQSYGKLIGHLLSTRSLKGGKMAPAGKQIQERVNFLESSTPGCNS